MNFLSRSASKLILLSFLFIGIHVFGQNDLCTNAITVTCTNNYSGTTVGATAEGVLPSCGVAPDAPGNWYVFAGNGSTITANLCTSGTYDTKLNVYSGTNCASLSSCVASNDDFCGLQSQVTFSTSVGVNYYILVNGYGSSTGTYTLNISCCVPGIPSCATYVSPINNATGVSQCSSLTWNAPATSGCSSVDSYDVYFGTTATPPLIGNTTSTSYAVTMSPSTTYYWQIRPKNASGSASSCPIFSYTSASNLNPQYTMVDDATSPSPYNCVSLTPDLNAQRGCAWDVNSALNFATNFTYEWTINLGSNDAGADGIAFVIQNDPLGRCKCGVAGNQLGAGGILNSLVIEVDTYMNWEDRDDNMINVGTDCISGTIEPDHLDIWLNGNINPNTDFSNCSTAAAERIVPSAVPLTNAGLDYNIENGQDHILRINWNAATQTITASILNSTLTTTYGTINYTFNPLTVFGTNSPYFGFTGSTGGLSNSQTFCNPITLLPVEITTQNIICDDSETILYWETASERNNKYFHIQGSKNANQFENLVTVEGAINSSHLLSYKYKVPNAKKYKYLRLLQEDLNGDIKTFDPISIDCIDNSDLTLVDIVSYLEDLKMVMYIPKTDNYNITVMNLSGQIVYSNSIHLEQGNQIINLPKDKLSTGIYPIKIENGTKSFSFKLSVN
jgi:hypothetical protein